MAQSPLKYREPDRIQIQETDESKHVVAWYIASLPDGTEKKSRVVTVTPENKNSYARRVLNAFLPAGYPHSVTGDYLEYQIYDSLQAFSSSIAGMLSSRAVLEGIGVGDSHASPTSALLLSVLQESMGRIATILFAHRLGTSLEPECKMYRLLADIFNDSAMILDCLSPALPKPSRVALLALSSCLRSLCGVAAGSSKASLSAHFATQGNLGELNAKDSSQETVISLLGMLAGSLVVGHITTKWATWTSMICLLAIHLGTNYLAVRAVSMRTLNRQRANIVFSRLFLDLSNRDGIEEVGKTSTTPLRILTPQEVSIQERIFERDGILRSSFHRKKGVGYCEIGVSLKDILKLFDQTPSGPGKSTSPPISDFHKLLDIYKDDDYIMMWDQGSLREQRFLIAIKEGAGNQALLSAWMHALYHAEWWDHDRPDGETRIETLQRIKLFVQQMQERYSLFEELRKAGWDIETGALETKSGTRMKILE